MGNPGIRVLVCGGRDLDDIFVVYDALEELRKQVGTFGVLIHGYASGADTAAALWASSNNIKLAGFRADWNKYNKQAGAMRNQRMLDEGMPDLVVAFPGGAGTNDMVQRAIKAGVRVVTLDAIWRKEALPCGFTWGTASAAVESRVMCYKSKGNRCPRPFSACFHRNEHIEWDTCKAFSCLSETVWCVPVEDEDA